MGDNSEFSPSVDHYNVNETSACENQVSLSSQSVLNYGEVASAMYTIRKEFGVQKTPLEPSPQLSQMLGMEIYFKKEYSLPTGSFKERGARNTLELLSQKQKKKGVIAASAGNHALALAYHGQQLNIPVTVVTPVTAPIMKVSQCESYGAEVISKGKDIHEAMDEAKKLAKEKGLRYVNGYNDMEILAGQGTAAMEILEQLDGKVDAVVIPVGGGGLLAGMATVFKHLAPHVKVIAVESVACPSFREAMKAGRPVHIDAVSSLADGLAVPEVGDRAFATACGRVDCGVVVAEEWIGLAILRLAEIEKCVVEGAGATGLAACLSGQLDTLLRGKTVVVMLCGGNIDTTVLGRSLERGLAADGRLVRFSVHLMDWPGTLSELTSILKDHKASIKDIVHERTWLDKDKSVYFVQVTITVETRDQRHAKELKGKLKKEYGPRLVWTKSKAESQSPSTVLSKL